MVSQKGVVLIVDDNHNNISVLSTLLSTYGFIVIGASNGEKGITMAKKRLPDLILLDIMMPGKDGYQVCTELKSDEVTADIPVIFISALDEMKAIVKAFEHGAADYVSKPFEEAEVIARVKAHTQNALLKKELVSRAKDMEKFAYHAAHDLRSPLSIFTGLLSLMQDDEDFKDNMYLDQMEEASNNLNSLITSLLSLADSTRQEPEMVEIDFLKLVNEIKLEFKTQIEEKNAIIVAEGDVKFMADKTQMMILLRNLIGNSLKYSKHDEVSKIEIKAVEEEGIIFEIKDNGLGFQIKEDYNVLDPFIRLHSHVKGHGIGLSICAKILEQHHGFISYESEVGVGSTFKVKIPKIIS